MLILSEAKLEYDLQCENFLILEKELLHVEDETKSKILHNIKKRILELDKFILSA